MATQKDSDGHAATNGCRKNAATRSKYDTLADDKRQRSKVSDSRPKSYKRPRSREDEELSRQRRRLSGEHGKENALPETHRTHKSPEKRKLSSSTTRVQKDESSQASALHKRQKGNRNSNGKTQRRYSGYVDEIVASSPISDEDVVLGSGQSADTRVSMSFFATAGGKKISVDRETFVSRNKIQKDLNTKKARNTTKLIGAQGDQKVSNVQLKGPKTAPSTSDAPKTMISAFSTAKGNAVSVSTSSLHHYASLETEAIPSKPPPVQKPMTLSANETSSLFQTAKGNSIAISKAKLKQYEEKLSDEPPLSSKQPTGQESKSKSVPSLFSTGSGKQVSISKDQIDRYERKLNVHPASNDTAAPSLFQTGSGKSVSISKSALKKYEAQFEANDSDVQSRAVEAPNQSVEAPSSKRDTTVASLFQTARNKSVHVAKSKVDFYSSMLRKDKELNASPPSITKIEKATISPSESRPEAKAQSKIASRLQKSPKKAKSGTIYPRRHGAAPFVPPKPHLTKSARRLDTDTPASQPTNDVRAPFPYVETMRISLGHLRKLSPSSPPSSPHVTFLTFITIQNASNVVFKVNSTEVSFSTTDIANSSEWEGVRELYDGMISKKQLLEKDGASFAWFRHHFQLIVLKCARTELLNHTLLLHTYLTKDQVLYQIHKRYHQELVKSQRSILKKVMQTDHRAGDCFVLQVVLVLFPDESHADAPIALVLSDGWHLVYALPDATLSIPLARQCHNLLFQKLVVWNATLENASDGIDPFETALYQDDVWVHPRLKGSPPILRLSSNGTRPASRDAPLGLETLVKRGKELEFTWLKSLPLHTLHQDGGLVRSIKVKVERVSPLLYLQQKHVVMGPRVLSADQLDAYLDLRSECLETLVGKRMDVEKAKELFPPPVPFIKVNVTCRHANGRARGEVTIWRPPMDVLIEAGQEYYMSHLKVTYKTNDGDDCFVRLGTTRSSRLDKTGEKETCQEEMTIQNAVRHIAGDVEKRTKMGERVAIDLSCVVLTASDLYSVPLSSFPTWTDENVVDTLGVVVEEQERSVMVTDSSGHVMSVTVPHYMISLPRQSKSSRFELSRGSKLWQEKQPVLLKGVDIVGYDVGMGILRAEVTASTMISPSSTSVNEEQWYKVQERVCCQIMQETQVSSISGCVIRLLSLPSSDSVVATAFIQPTSGQDQVQVHIQRQHLHTLSTSSADQTFVFRVETRGSSPPVLIHLE